MTAFRAATATDAGRVRSSNQDMSLATSDLVAVADGMGGHVGGEVAARLAIETLQRSFATSKSASGLVAATSRANRAVYDESERQATLRGMGTTLTAAALVRSGRHERIAVANVGDSRAYVLRGGELVQLTEDHSLVEEMVRNGELTPSEAAVHPHRHILTRALGIDGSVKVDSWEVDPVPGTRLLLCSDGLTNECSDAEIAATLAAEPDPEAAALRLVALAVAHGGSDNVTVVVADVDPDAASPAGSAQSRGGDVGVAGSAAAGSAAAGSAAAGSAAAGS
ncbi:MAG: Stp1/IreP family PP2C-type Ser/Thr phosphatase, partial [Acidimicrobiales bacterium]